MLPHPGPPRIIPPSHSVIFLISPLSAHRVVVKRLHLSCNLKKYACGTDAPVLAVSSCPLQAAATCD